VRALHTGRAAAETVSSPDCEQLLAHTNSATAPGRRSRSDGVLPSFTVRSDVQLVALLLTPCAQIRFILLQNRQGRTRLAKYYVPLEDGEKRKLEQDIHRLVVNRDPKATNFVEVRDACARAPLFQLRGR
jgi:Clathrin adaptor complex small chain